MNWPLIFLIFVLLCFAASVFENYLYIQKNKKENEKRKQEILKRLNNS